MSRKSLKHRQLSAAHRAAKEAGNLDDFYAQRDAARGVVTPPAAQPPPPSPQGAPATPFKSPERTAWDSAYSGPEVGPVGASWPEDGRHVPYMVWRLPVRSAFNGPRRDNF